MAYKSYTWTCGLPGLLRNRCQWSNADRDNRQAFFCYEGGINACSVPAEEWRQFPAIRFSLRNVTMEKIMKRQTEFILVSACLLEQAVRWHGKPVRPSPYVKKYLAEHPGVKVIAVCPEVLGGLSVPRPPVKSRSGKIFVTCEDKSMRDEVTGLEVTEYFVAGAEKTLAIAKKHKCKTAILLKTSPSCSRSGITGKLLLENCIEVISVF